MPAEDQSKNIGYRLHCLAIEMSELQNEIQRAKDLLIHKEMLRHDFIEIKKNAGEPINMFLLNSYW